MKVYLKLLKRDNSFFKIVLLMFLFMNFFSFQLYSAPPDSPPSYEEITTGLGLGILFEVHLGTANNGGLMDDYKTIYGDAIETNGFKSVRIRIAASQFEENDNNAPNYILQNAFWTDLDAMVDDLLPRHTNQMYVIITPRFVRQDKTVFSLDMIEAYWRQLAEHYKDYTHRVVFDIELEPSENYYSDTVLSNMYTRCTHVIRSNNPTRYIVYYYRYHSSRQQRDGPGETDFNILPTPQEAGPYRIYDTHFLGDISFDQRQKRFGMMRKAWEFREVYDYPVWSGAWGCETWDTNADLNETKLLTDEMVRLGIPGTYLMMNGGSYSIYDAQTHDRDGDGIYDEWNRPDIANYVGSRAPIIWYRGTKYVTNQFHAQDDTYVNFANPSTIYGTDNNIKIKKPGSFEAVGYIKFPAWRIPGPVVSAKLQLRSTDLVGSIVNIHVVPTTNWNETNTTWNTAPAYNSAILDSVNVNVASNWYEWDVTSAITNGATSYTFALTTTDANRVDFFSRSADFLVSDPNLVIVVNPVWKGLSLVWSSNTGYSTDGINPDIGTNTTLFRFEVKFYNKNNNTAPVTNQVWIDVNDNGVYETGEKFTIFSNSGTSYSNGVIFTNTLSITYTGDGYLNYKFYFTDSSHNVASGDPALDNTLSLVFQPDIIIKKTKISPVGNTSPGDYIRFKIDYTNNGLPINNAKIIDILPQHTVFSNGSLYDGSILSDAGGDDAGYFDSGNNQVMYYPNGTAPSSPGSLNTGESGSFFYTVFVVQDNATTTNLMYITNKDGTLDRSFKGPSASELALDDPVLKIWDVADRVDKHWRSVIGVDISSIPMNAIIVSATQYIYIVGLNNQPNDINPYYVDYITLSKSEIATNANPTNWSGGIVQSNFYSFSAPPKFWFGYPIEGVLKNVLTNSSLDILHTFQQRFSGTPNGDTNIDGIRISSAEDTNGYRPYLSVYYYINYPSFSSLPALITNTVIFQGTGMSDITNILEVTIVSQAPPVVTDFIITKSISNVTLHNVNISMIPGATITYIAFVSNTTSNVGTNIVIYDMIQTNTIFNTNFQITGTTGWIAQYSVIANPNQNYGSSDYFSSVPGDKSAIRWIRWIKSNISGNESAQFIIKVIIK